MNELALFAGAGGGILAGVILGWRTVCAVEIDSYCRSVLLARQQDGSLGRFPIWDDVRTFDGMPWRGDVDVISGGFPCQDISSSGTGRGIDGERSGLWKEFARIIGEVRPSYVFVENSPMLTSRGLGRVLGDLSSMGYDAQWGVFSACSVGMPHTRDRLFLVANSAQVMGEKRIRDGKTPSWTIPRFSDREMPKAVRLESDADILRVANGMARELDRIAAIGNGQVPAVAALAWSVLNKWERTG